MDTLPWQKRWPYAGMLALSLALGIAIAAGVDAWSENEEATAVALLADAAAALVIAAAMAAFARLTNLRLFDKAANGAPRHGPREPLS